MEAVAAAIRAACISRPLVSIASKGLCPRTSSMSSTDDTSTLWPATSSNAPPTRSATWTPSPETSSIGTTGRQVHEVNGEMLKGATSRDEDQGEPQTAFDFNPDPEEERYDKRHIDSLAGDLLKKSEGGPWDKRYVDAIAGDLLKRSDARWPASAKRYLDSIAGELLKRDDPQVPERGAKRYIDSIAGDLLKREPSDPYTAQKRYIDAIAGDLLKRDAQGDKAKRYLDSIAGELLRRGHPYGRYARGTSTPSLETC
ncbi:uncharacterized protein LOC112555734 isoform X1 [Pomacea canaliculata]|uniref:uncharacterized protein LOC112555734 isoform X1 n=1 Tax=Pomacea canaliculata TaxID=400727 RepID=UPI000D735779|nr:uncharacterized protein LOC112555734 isoform X1 [Pomacea canaliculata]